MDHGAHHSSMCGVSSHHLCSLVSSILCMPGSFVIWTAVTMAHRRLLKKTRRGWEGRFLGHSFSLVNWHVQKEEVSSSLVLQGQLRVAWVTLAAA